MSKLFCIWDIGKGRPGDKRETQLAQGIRSEISLGMEVGARLLKAWDMLKICIFFYVNKESEWHAQNFLIGGSLWLQCAEQSGVKLETEKDQWGGSCSNLDERLRWPKLE